MGTAIFTIIPSVLAVSSALMVGFALGRLTTGWGEHGTARTESCGGGSGGGGSGSSSKGAKRRARMRKSEEKSKARAAGFTSPSSTEIKLQSRRARNRKRKLAPGCLALDAWTRVARSFIDVIGAGEYESLLLIPRASFLDSGRFRTYAECVTDLVSLGHARAITSGIEQLRLLYVSCSWASATDGEGTDWAAQDFETTHQFLERHPDISFVYVGRSCVADRFAGAARSAQLLHVVPALLRSDAVLVLPRQAVPPCHDRECNTHQPAAHTDFRLGAWSRMELAVAAVGQAKMFVAFRADPFPQSVLELNLRKSDARATAEQAVGALRSNASSRENERMMAAACENWLGADLNPLAALEEARVVVATALKSDEGEMLESIRSMRSPPTTEAIACARASLGEEYVEGERELALSMLLFTVVCSQPKERATYTDSFVEDAAKMEISYRPIGVVRSPYRERFGTPRQPQVTASVLHGGAQEGQLVFFKGHRYEEALQDLNGFDMIWVISHMHLNKGWNSKVRPPRLPEERKGLFSTRSPHRPNAIALSSVRVDWVDAAKGVIHVHGLDLLDGTPVLDVKPYISYCDAFPSTKAGWLDALGSDHEAQGDFLPKFSVGATLVHTVTSPKSTPVFPTDPLLVPRKPVDQDSTEENP